MRFVHSLPVALAFVLLTLAGACYNPKIPEGALKCGGEGRSECPDGWVCAGGLCFSSSSAATTGNDAGAGAGADTGTAACVADLYPACSGGQTGVCDPVCQQGCGCAERCAISSTNALGCFPADRTQTTAPYDACDATLKTDLCRPGTMCLAERENRPECGAHCYRICREDRECTTPGLRGNGRCLGLVILDKDQVAPFKTCTPPIESCEPVGEDKALSSCKEKYGDNFGCYMVSSASYPDLHICDCKGLLSEGQECMNEHDCKPGNECVNYGGKAICRKLCRVDALVNAIGGCAATQMCQPFPNSKATRRLGFCRPI